MAQKVLTWPNSQIESIVYAVFTSHVYSGIKCDICVDFNPKTLLLTDGDHFLTSKRPKKVISFYYKAPALITETEQK